LGKYNEIMEHITVTPDMRMRVLENVSRITAAEEKTGKVIPFTRWRRIAAVAACFAVLVIGGLALHSIRQQPQETPVDVAGGGINELSSLEELESVYGFDIEEMTYLPFEAAETVCSDFFGEIAEVDYYSAGNETVTFRKSAGTEDNSGIYEEFEQEISVEIGEWDVTLKGSGDEYSLAVWNDGTYSYSVSTAAGYGEEVWHDMIEGLQ